GGALETPGWGGRSGTPRDPSVPARHVDKRLTLRRRSPRMSQTKRFLVLAGAALSLGGVNAALAQQSNADETRAIVAEMLADAQTRTSLLAAGGAGHDGQFYLASPDGSFRLNVGGQIQFRYILDFRDAGG